jgi:O-antigen/teichoic acid export membrane protein
VIAMIPGKDWSPAFSSSLIFRLRTDRCTERKRMSFPSHKGSGGTFALPWLPAFAQPVSARLRRSPLAARLLTGTFWNLAGSVLARGLSLVASVLAARLLGREAFGQLGVIQGTLGMFGIFAGFGLGVTATKHVAQFRRTDPERAGRIVALTGLWAGAAGLLIWIAFLGCAPWLAQHTLAAPHLAYPLRVGAFLTCLSAVQGAGLGVLGGFEAFRGVARQNFISGLLTFVGLLGGVWLGRLNGALWGLTAAMAVTCALTLRAVQVEARRAGVPLSFAGCHQEWKTLAPFCALAVLGNIVVTPVNWICSALVVNQAGGYSEMAVYNAATQWRNAILFLPTILGAVAMPMMSHLKGSGDERGFARLLGYSLRLNGAAALLVALPILLLAGPLLRTYGPGFDRGQAAFIVLVFSGVIVAVNNALSRSLVSEGRMKTDFAFHAIWGATGLAFGAWLIPHYSGMGLAVAMLLAALVQMTSQIAWLTHRGKDFGRNTASREIQST